MTQRNPIAPRRTVIAGGFIRRTPANAAAAQQHRVEHLLRLCHADYTAAATQRHRQNHRDDVHLCTPERERGVA
ncbi:hypothetical protein [Streptomyces sp. NPDC004685]